jgi:glycosyltransferase involved in cell wall biosynthesis
LYRTLFCLENGRVGGGSKIICEIADRLTQQGQRADIFIWHQKDSFDWWQGSFNVLATESIEEAVSGDYDFILFSNLCLLPLALPYVARAVPIMLCQGYEGFCYGGTVEKMLTDNELIQRLYQLPVPLVSVSKGIERTLQVQTGRDSFFMPVALDKNLFYRREPGRKHSERKRVLLVGDYLNPLKGLSQGFEVLESLSQELPVELVLITQVQIGQRMLNKFKLEKEVHVRPPLAEIPDIFACCDAYCCTSWYEGLGLPPLEAMSVGVPVVCTRNIGVTDYGVDGDNMLLCDPGAMVDLKDALKRILTTPDLVERLRAGGFKTVEQYDWSTSMKAFNNIQHALAEHRPENSAKFSIGEMNELSRAMEAEGFYTPRETYHSMRDIFTKFGNASKALLSNDLERVDFLKTISVVKDEIKPHMVNPKTQYYSAFKSRFDAIQLLLALSDDPNFNDRVRVLARDA